MIFPLHLIKALSGKSYRPTEGCRRVKPHWEIAASASLQHKRQFSYFIMSYIWIVLLRKRTALLFRALWEQSFPSDCVSMPTSPQNCQSCSNSPSTVNGQIKLCLSPGSLFSRCVDCLHESKDEILRGLRRCLSILLNDAPTVAVLFKSARINFYQICLVISLALIYAVRLECIQTENVLATANLSLIIWRLVWGYKAWSND